MKGETGMGRVSLQGKSSSNKKGRVVIQNIPFLTYTLLPCAHTVLCCRAMLTADQENICGGTKINVAGG